jgi:hypothetical protein
VQWKKARALTGWLLREISLIVVVIAQATLLSIVIGWMVVWLLR